MLVAVTTDAYHCALLLLLLLFCACCACAGSCSAAAQIWDVTKLKRTRTMTGHRQRVGTQAWSSHMLSSGSRDKAILLRDVRVPEPYVEKLVGHKSEVCGLKVGGHALLWLRSSCYLFPVMSGWAQHATRTVPSLPCTCALVFSPRLVLSSLLAPGPFVLSIWVQCGVEAAPCCLEVVFGCSAQGRRQFNPQQTHSCTAAACRCHAADCGLSA